ncbi:MAG: glycosyltransferase [Planctomycetota bacterium]
MLIETMLSTGLLLTLTVGLAAWCVHVLLTLQAWESRRYARSRATQAPPRASQSVALIVPCKGKELNARQNLAALLSQDYSYFTAIFVVESRDDPAVADIEAVRSQFAHVRSELIVAGRCSDSGQKVHNLLAATECLPDAVDVLAFADSDACPDSDWLGHLVGRLRHPKVGAATGYRWFVPESNSLPNLVLYSINSAVAGLLGPGTLGVVWGGAWAIRRDVFDEIDLRTAWQGTLSDDLVANRAIREAGLEVRFEPNCVVTSPLSCTWAQAIEFAQRQYRISRLYLTPWWAMTLISASICQLAIGSHLLLAMLPGVPGMWRAALALSVSGMIGMTMFRAKLRQDLVSTYVKQPHRLRMGQRFDVLASPWVGIMNLLLLAGSVFGRRIRWRGISYLVSDTGRSQLIARHYSSPPSPVLLKFPAPANSAKPRQAA